MEDTIKRIIEDLNEMGIQNEDYKTYPLNTVEEIEDFFNDYMLDILDYVYIDRQYSLREKRNLAYCVVEVLAMKDILSLDSYTLEECYKTVYKEPEDVVEALNEFYNGAIPEYNDEKMDIWYRKDGSFKGYFQFDFIKQTEMIKVTIDSNILNTYNQDKLIDEIIKRYEILI